MIDIDTPMPDSVVDELKAVGDVLRVRVLR